MCGAPGYQAYNFASVLTGSDLQTLTAIQNRLKNDSFGYGDIYGNGGCRDIAQCLYWV